MVGQLHKTAGQNDTEDFRGERSRAAVGCADDLRPQSQHLQTIRDEHQARVELGAILGFTTGALVLLPIGYVYGQLVKEIPDAAGEAAYVARFFPPSVSFATGWIRSL